MQVQSTRFGLLDIDPSTLIEFPLGLPGFEGLHQFKLFHEDKPDPSVLWLQSVEDADVSLNLIEAQRMGVNYQITLSDEECAVLQLTDPADVVLLLVISNHVEQSGEAPIRANTASPVLINTKSGRGFQKVGLQADIVFRNA